MDNCCKNAKMVSSSCVNHYDIRSCYLLFFYSSGALEEHWNRSSLLLNNVTAIVGMGFGSLGSIALVFLGAMVLQPLNITSSMLGELGLAMAKPLGPIGAVLYAVALFGTCLGAALEVSLSIGYQTAQIFGWEWGEDKTPREAARYNLVLLMVMLVVVAIGFVGIDPLQLSLFASTLIALFLPISLLPFLIFMNDAKYLRDKTNGWFSNSATICIVILAFVVALVGVSAV